MATNIGMDSRMKKNNHRSGDESGVDAGCGEYGAVIEGYPTGDYSKDSRLRAEIEGMFRNRKTVRGYWRWIRSVGDT